MQSKQIFLAAPFISCLSFFCDEDYQTAKQIFQGPGNTQYFEESLSSKKFCFKKSKSSADEEILKQSRQKSIFLLGYPISKKCPNI